MREATFSNKHSKPTPDEGLYKSTTFLARAIAGLVPGGGTAVDFATLLIGDPAVRRRERFLEDLEERLSSLEARGLISLDELRADERVSAILLQSIQIAARSHGEQKLKVLRDATVAGVSIDSNRALAGVVLNAIDGLTDLHVHILRALQEAINDPSRFQGAGQWFEEHDFRSKMLGRALGLDRFPTIAECRDLRKVEGVPDPDSEEYQVVYSDLLRIGLIDPDVQQIDLGTINGGPSETRRRLALSPLAKRVLHQIAQGAGLAEGR